MTLARFRRAALAGCVALALVLASGPSNAQMTVFDPTNYVQNVLSAARALEQINNQIQSLQNEAQSLVNEARNLASLPYSSLQQLHSQIARTQALLGQAQRIAFDVREIEQAFALQYRTDLSASDRALIGTAEERWRNSVAAFEDAMRVQASVVGNIDGARAEMSALVASSQSAEGALQAAQAGNQLLALQSQQLVDLTAILAAQARAESLEQARAAAAQDQSREQFRRFMTRSGYEPQTVTIFRD